MQQLNPMDSVCFLSGFPSSALDHILRPSQAFVMALSQPTFWVRNEQFISDYTLIFSLLDNLYPWTSLLNYSPVSFIIDAVCRSVGFVLGWVSAFLRRATGMFLSPSVASRKPTPFH